MRKATLSPNPLPVNKQRFIVRGLPEAHRIITRDNIAMELGASERPDKTVVPIGRVNSGEFNITLDFADDLGRGDYVKWFEQCIDRGTSARSEGRLTRDLIVRSENDTSAIPGVHPEYKKMARIIYHRLYIDSQTRPIIISMVGCWPKSITFPDFDMDSEDMCTLEMTISYDDVEIIQ